MRGKLSTLADIAERQNIDLFIVGGFVRDSLLGKESRDVDLTVVYEAGQFAKQVAWRMRGDYELLDTQLQYSRVTLIANDGNPMYLDFSLLQGGSIEEDLRRRDFTVNAMAIALKDYLRSDDWQSDVIDPCGGKQDLAAGLLRLTSEESLQSDPVRLLRSVRFLHKLGFQFAPGTPECLQKHAPLVKRALKVKLAMELFQLLEQNYAADALCLLQSELGILGCFLAPVALMTKKVADGENLYTHGLNTCRQLQYLLNGESGMDKTLLAQIASHLSQCVTERRTKRSFLRLACLLHDIGKLTMREDNRPQVQQGYSHELAAHDYIECVAARLRLDDVELRYLARLVCNHSRPLYLITGPDVLGSKLRFFQQFKDAVPELLLLAMANTATRHGVHSPRVKQLEEVLQQYFSGHLTTLPEPVLNARDLMEFFNLPPTRAIGEYLEQIYEAQLAGSINNRQEALSFVSQLLAQRIKT